MTNKTLVVKVLIGFIALFLLLIAITLFKPVYGYVRLDLELANTDGVVITMNNKDLEVVGVSEKYKLKTGQKNILVKKEGYKDFSSSFVIEKDKETVLNIVLQPTNPATPEENNETVTTSLSEGIGDLKITNPVYFYNNSWAFSGVVAPDGNTAFAVLSIDPKTNIWSVKLGPGTFFNQSDVTDIPEDVVTYMYQNNYLFEEQ